MPSAVGIVGAAARECAPISICIYNVGDLRELPADDPPYPGGVTNRMDSHGHYVFRWSDDHGKTWSRERGTIPVREFELDQVYLRGGGRLTVTSGRLFGPNAETWNRTGLTPDE